MAVHNIEGMMSFEKVSNGWKCTVECYPTRLHYIKLTGSPGPNRWMLDHIEMQRTDMYDRIDAAFEEAKLFGKV